MITGPLPLPLLVATLINRTIERLRGLQPQPDPIVPQHLQRPYNVLNSAVRMDGHLLEAALFEALSIAPHLTITRTPQIYLPRVADQIVGGRASAEVLAGSDLFYDPRGGRKVAPDGLIIDRNRNAIDFIEAKRGHGKTDSGKTRQTTTDLLCLQLIGRSYAKLQLGVDVAISTAVVCAIHGVTTMPLELQASVEELEVRYQTDIRTFLNATQAEFRSRLEELLFEEALDGDLHNLFELIDSSPASIN